MYSTAAATGSWMSDLERSQTAPIKKAGDDNNALATACSVPLWVALIVIASLTAAGMIDTMPAGITFICLSGALILTNVHTFFHGNADRCWTIIKIMLLISTVVASIYLLQGANAIEDVGFAILIKSGIAVLGNTLIFLCQKKPEQNGPAMVIVTQQPSTEGGAATTTTTSSATGVPEMVGVEQNDY